MYYATEFMRPRRLVQLQVFVPPAKRKQFLRRYAAQLHATFDNSTMVHGVRYISEKQSHLLVRYFWFAVVVAAVIGCTAIYITLMQRHNEQMLISIVETTRWPVSNIPFPAVAVCPWNRVNWVRGKLAEKRFLPHNNDEQVSALFHELLVSLEDSSFGKFDGLSALAERDVHSVANISLYELAKYVAYRCDELFVKDSCVFGEIAYDCCKLFVLETTDKGICLVFNSEISEESRKKQVTNTVYPYVLSKSGEGSGLLFTLRLDRNTMRPETKLSYGMNLIIKSPQQWSNSVTSHLYRNTANYITVRPELVETSRTTYRMTPESRRCYFQNEKNPIFDEAKLAFNRQNCLAVCRQNYVLKVCNCTLPTYLPAQPNTRECQVHDFRCLYENRDIFSYLKQRDQRKYIRDPRRGMFCPCLANCYSLQYMQRLNVKLLDKREFGINANVSLTKCDVHFSRRLMTKYITKLQYTFTDLVANFGGILGLLLGASVLSLAELAHTLIKLLSMFVAHMRQFCQQGRNSVSVK